MRRSFIGLAVIALAGCGALGPADGDDDGGDDADPPPADGGTCGVGVRFDPATGAVQGDTIYAEAELFPSDGSFLTYTWTVQFENGDTVPHALAAADGHRIRFEATQAGYYEVFADITGVDVFCGQGQSGINVPPPGANTLRWRLRYVPPPGAAVPPQERSFSVAGGANYDTGETVLEDGVVASGSIVDGAGAGMPAYLRLVPGGSPDLAIDGFADADGAFAVRARSVVHELLIVPFRTDIPARLLKDWTPGSETIVLDGGSEVSGTVRDPAGNGLANAAVTLRIDGVPSTVDFTDDNGGFAVRARPHTGGVVVVDVVPPAGLGLPRLTTTGALLDLAQAVDVSYAPGLAIGDLAGTTVQQGGAANPGARVTFTGTIAAAGTLSNGATTTGASGRFAITAVTGAGGVLATTRVPSVAATAIVDGDAAGAGAPGVVAVDLATPPATIDAPAAATVTGRVVGPTGTPVAGAELRALPTGALAAADLDQVHGFAGTDGTFSLPVAGGGSYDLVVVDRTGGLAQARRAIVASGAIDDISLPAGLTLSGQVSGPSGALPSLAITVYCGGDCTERSVPAAETITDGTGTFRTRVVDPGVAPP